MCAEFLDTFFMQGSNFSPRKQNVLECRVCEDIFTLQGEKVPRLLYCGHTICHSCLLRIPLTDNNSINCPFDRQPTPVVSSGVWGLKKNFALLELLERLQLSYEKETASYLATAEIIAREKNLHVPCDENDAHVAVLYCTVCASHLCELCSSSTHATRTLTKHRRIPLSEKPREKPTCSSHPSHIAEFTCLQEECCSSTGPPVLMCYLCKDYGRHKNHKHALVETEAHNVRIFVKNSAIRMRNWIEEMSQTCHTLEQALIKLEGQTNAEGHVSEIGTGQLARSRVESYFTKLRETLYLQEMAAINAIDTYVRKKICSQRQLQEDLMSWLSQVAVVCAQFEQMFVQDDVKLLSASREISDTFKSIDKQQQQFADLVPEPDASYIPPITFTKDNRIHIGPKIEMRIVTLGLDGAGKTSLLFKLKQNEFIAQIPTVGFNVETVEYKNFKFTIWDVGGQPKLRPLWKHYYLNTQAVIFVIDSSDKNRLEESCNELAKLLTEQELKDAVILIFANKQDAEDCETIENITDIFSLYKLCCGRSWHIQACDVQTGNGLHDGLDWLCTQLIASSGVYDITSRTL